MTPTVATETCVVPRAKTRTETPDGNNTSRGSLHSSQSYKRYFLPKNIAVPNNLQLQRILCSCSFSVPTSSHYYSRIITSFPRRLYKRKFEAIYMQLSIQDNCARPKHTSCRHKRYHCLTNTIALG